MSRLGDKSYDTCAPGCGCEDDLQDLEESGSFFMPENKDDDDE